MMGRQYAEIILGDDAVRDFVSRTFSQNHGRIPLDRLRADYSARFRLGIPVLEEEAVRQMPQSLGRGRIFYYPIENGIVSEEGFLRRG